MKISKWFSITSVIFLLLTSCRKNDDGLCVCNYEKYTNPIADYNFEKKALDFPSPLPAIFYSYPQGYAVGSPVFNPSNKFEIIFLYGLTSTPVSQGVEIWKYNFCNNSFQFVANNVMGNIDWSKKGWILFNGTDNQLYKVKDNGDSLTQFILPSTTDGALWSPDGSKIFYKSTSGNEKMKLISENGLELKEYDINMYDWIWHGENTIAAIFNGIKLLNIENDQFTPVGPQPGDPNFPIILYDNDQSVLYRREQYGQGNVGYYMASDLVTGEKTVIDSLYQSYIYINGSYNGDGKTILTLAYSEFKDSVPSNNHNVYSYLLIMDVNGANKRILNISL